MRNTLTSRYFLLWLACLFCVIAQAQPSQLPSLFGDADAQNDYQKNSILKPGEDPVAKIHDLIFIKTTISKRTCFTGEPILVTYQLYTAVSCHSRVTKQVAFSGCSVIEMTSDEPEQIQKEKGKIYRVQLIRKVQLIPLQAGELTIPPSTVNNEVGFSTTDNPYRITTYSADVSSEPYSVQVNPLPDKQPDDFSGITGKFSIQAKTDSNIIEAGENNRLQVTISGIGNIEAVNEPAIKWPAHVEHFDPTDSQHINRMNFPESGDKTFNFSFVPTQKGKITIPEIQFTYFNTESKKFETTRTQPIVLTVTNATKKRNPLALVSNNLSNDKYLWFVPAIALVVITVWLVAGKKKQKPIDAKPAAVITTPVAPKPVEEVTVHPDYELLLKALSEAEDNRSFFTNAKTLLISAIQYNVSPKQDDETILINLLHSKDETMAKEARRIVSVCNQGLYSPVEDEAARAHLAEQIGDFIQKLEAA